jgi:hypothetical protein
MQNRNLSDVPLLNIRASGRITQRRTRLSSAFIVLELWWKKRKPQRGAPPLSREE